MAHITMLETMGLLTPDELKKAPDWTQKISMPYANEVNSLSKMAWKIYTPKLKWCLHRQTGWYRKEDTQRSFTQRSGIAGFEIIYPSRTQGCCWCNENTVRRTGSRKATNTKMFDAGIHPPADSYAQSCSWTMVGAYAEGSHRWYTVLAGSISYDKPGSAGSAAGYGSSFKPFTYCPTFDSTSTVIVMVWRNRWDVERWNVMGRFAMCHRAGTLGQDGFRPCIFQLSELRS